MRIHYTVGKNSNNGMDVSINANIDEHMLKLIDYLATKISGAKKSAMQILWELKWLSKLPEWVAFKLKASNPLAMKKLRKELNDKGQELVKRYKIPDGYFIVDAAAYEEIQKRDAAKRKKVKTEK